MKNVARKGKPLLLIFFLLISTEVFLAYMDPARAETETITINPDGSITPTTTLISTTDYHTYYLTANVSLVGSASFVELRRSNIVIDGNGHEIQGTGGNVGFFSAASIYSGFYTFNVTFRNLIMKGVGTCIDMTYEYVRGATVTHCYFSTPWIVHLGYWQGTTGFNTVTDNEFVGSGNLGGWEMQQSVIARNSFSGGSTASILSLTNAPNSTIYDNQGYVRIDLTNCPNAIISNNTITGNVSDYGAYIAGISAISSANVTITRNSLTNCGISSYTNTNCIISENNISGSMGGISTQYDQNGLVSKNLISNSSAQSGSTGIICNPSNQTILDNVVSNKQTGISINAYNGLAPCKIYHNHFINNSRQVLLYSPTSPEGVIVWDNGYPFGGNFWSDYTGVDFNYDGIGDSPYTFTKPSIVGTGYWGGRDRFPLLNSPYYGQPILTAFFNYTMSPDFTVTFDGSLSYASNSTIIKYEWDFGDGAKATGIKVTHPYNASGTVHGPIMFSTMNQASSTFSTTLKVTDSTGATSSTTRTIGQGNFIAREILPVQAYKVDPTEESLVQEKSTDFWIQCESTFTAAMKISIKIDAVGFSPDSYEFNYTLTPGWNEFYVSQAMKTSPMFKPWLKPIASFTFTIDPHNLTPETVETDNSPPTGYTEVNVTQTKPLRILFVPVRFKNEDGYPGVYTGYSKPELARHATESIAYIMATYPVPDARYLVGGDFTVSCTNSPITAKNSAGDEIERPKTQKEAEDALVSIANNLAAKAIGGYDRVVGVVRTDWFTTIPGFNYVRGYMVEYILASSVVTLGNWPDTPHEIGHSYNLTDTNYRDDGYYVLGRTEVNDAQTWMSTSEIANPPAEPKFQRPVPYFWVSDAQYSIMLSLLRNPNDPEILSFSADFWRNGTVKLGDFHRYQDGYPTYNEGDTGNYSLVQLDGSNNVLKTIGFNITFDGVISDVLPFTLDRLPVTFTVPYSNTARTIQVRDRLGNVVASITVSANPPSVHVTSPNGGEILKSQTAQISWTASDPDGGTLSYDLLVSSNGGVTWDPVVTGLKQTSYNLILTGFSGGNKYLVKVVACDGVNTAEDVSDNYFTVASFSVRLVSVPQTTRVRDSAFYLLNVTSYGGFSDVITLNATCPSTNLLNFTWDGGSTLTPVVNGSTYILLEAKTLSQIQGGNHTLYLSGTSGNNTEVAVAYLYVEPYGSIRINNGATYTNSTAVKLQLTSIPTTWGQVRFSNNGTIWSDWEDPTTSYNWTLSSGDGAKTVYYLVQDDNGLTETYNATIILDTTPPVANAGQNQNVQVGIKVTFDGSGSIDNMGVASYLWNFGDGTTGTGATPTHTYTNAGTYSVKLTVVDVAGNSAANTITVTAAGVIPEFSPVVMLAAFVVLSLIISIVFKRKSNA